MPEVVDIPRIGKVKRSQIIGGLAVAAAIAGWYWWHARTAVGAAAPPATSDMTGDVVTPSGVVGSGVGGGLSGAGAGGEAVTAPQTNAEWTARVIADLSAAGRNPAAIYSALGRYLSKAPLSDADIDIVRSAIAAEGTPPVGGPYPVTPLIGAHPSTPGTTRPPGPVTRPWTTTRPHGLLGPKKVYILVGGRTDVMLGWWAVSGATTYLVYVNGSLYSTEHGTFKHITGLRPGTRYTLAVRAVGSGGSPPVSHPTQTVYTTHA